MSYAARIVHKVPGRMRLQMESTTTSPHGLQEAMVHLQGLSMSQRVRGNPLTRTIVLEAEDEAQLDEVIAKARDSGVIDFQSGERAPGSRSVPKALNSLRVSCDRFLREVSDGALDFKSTLALTLAGLGITQSLRGKFLPAGMTLVFYAIGMLELDEIARKSETPHPS